MCLQKPRLRCRCTELTEEVYPPDTQCFQQCRQPGDTSSYYGIACN